MTLRPDTYRLHNGEKATAQFSTTEYETRLAGLRTIMAAAGVKAAIFTSMHSIAYYSGFLYCAFGRPYGLVENVVTGRPYRGQGLGRIVLQACIDHAKDAGAYKLMLLTGQARGVVGFYEKLGFSDHEKHGLILRF